MDAASFLSLVCLYHFDYKERSSHLRAGRFETRHRLVTIQDILLSDIHVFIVAFLFMFYSLLLIYTSYPGLARCWKSELQGGAGDAEAEGWASPGVASSFYGSKQCPQPKLRPPLPCLLEEVSMNKERVDESDKQLTFQCRVSSGDILGALTITILSEVYILLNCTK